jgi:hypothetical protein
MSDIQTSLGVKKELKSINVIQSEDWLKLAVFVDHAVTFNATDETQLRIQTHMEPKDPIPEDVKTTLTTYKTLDVACRKWIDKTYPGTSEMAREVIRHKEDCTIAYDAMGKVIQKAKPNCRTLDGAQAALMEDLQSEHPSAEAKKALTDLARIVERLWSDADTRRKQAVDLEKDIGDFQTKLGECDLAFNNQTEGYKKYGNESAEITRLKGEVKKINEELSGLRKKEADEIVVLETAPLYLWIPWPFGAIIMAGVLAGVGGDLDRVRKRITDLLPQLQTASATLAKDEAYYQYHQWGLKSTQEASKAGEDARTRLGRVKTAWTGITSDLKDLHDKLLAKAKNDVNPTDLNFAKLDLQQAQLEWDRLAGEALGYLQYQLVPASPAKTVADAMKGITLVKKAA